KRVSESECAVSGRIITDCTKRPSISPTETPFLAFLAVSPVPVKAGNGSFHRGRMHLCTHSVNPMKGFVMGFGLCLRGSTLVLEEPLPFVVRYNAGSWPTEPAIATT